jgi:NitT/TauT family transport system substrate-binding protein
MTPIRTPLAALAVATLAVAGCGKTETGTKVPTPVFSLAWSEYPSWSVFGVADERGLIDGTKGGMGPIETKHDVDIVLQQADYDTCLTLYASGSAHAVCITNMDVLNPAMSRPTVAVLPTSRSHGADALIVVDIADVDALKSHKVYGLAKSVSEYAFVRNLQELGKDPSAYEFVNMDPQAAATAMQTGDADVNAIMVWNPFVMQTLQSKPGSVRMFDSSSIPEEIIDMVAMARDALRLPGGDRFATALADTFYQVCGLMADPATEEETLVALGAKFSNLDAAAMREVVKQTLFYTTPADAQALFKSDGLKATMDKVTAFCVEQRIIPHVPPISYDGSRISADLAFDSTHLMRAAK